MTKNVFYIITHDSLINADSGARQRILQLLSIKSTEVIDFLVPETTDVSLLSRYNNVFKFKELYLCGRSLWLFTDFNVFYMVKAIGLLLSHRYDEIFIDFPRGFLVIWFFRRGAKLVYSSHGFEYEFSKLHTQHLPKLLHKVIVNYLRLQERIVSRICDKIICINKRDMYNFIAHYNLHNNKLMLLPFEKLPNKELNITKEGIRKKYGFDESDRIAIFHGSWGHPSNREAFEFIENVLAKQLLEVKFIFAGHGMERARNGNVYKLGYLENIEEALVMADFAVCPISSGSGTNIKIFDYINYNLKIIVSPHAKESLPEDYGNYVLCNCIDDYINAITLLSG